MLTSRPTSAGGPGFRTATGRRPEDGRKTAFRPAPTVGTAGRDRRSGPPVGTAGRDLPSAPLGRRLPSGPAPAPPGGHLPVTPDVRSGSVGAVLGLRPTRRPGGQGRSGRLRPGAHPLPRAASRSTGRKSSPPCVRRPPSGPPVGTSVRDLSRHLPVGAFRSRRTCGAGPWARCSASVPPAGRAGRAAAATCGRGRKRPRGPLPGARAGSRPRSAAGAWAVSAESRRSPGGRALRRHGVPLPERGRELGRACQA
ncbi:hypothetical protein SUDANB51_02425 [Streptomyces sp. enrichment culture]